MSKSLFIFLFSLIFVCSFLFFNFLNADVQQEISDRERQIQELEKQKEEFQKQIVEKQGQSRTMEGEIFILDTQIKKLQLEIRTLDLAIQQTGLEIDGTVKNIDAALAKIEKIKESLGQFLRLLDQNDRETLVEILFKNRDLSDFFGNLESIMVSQEKAQVIIKDLKQLKIEFETEQEKLEIRKTEQVGLRNVQQIQKLEVDLKKKEKNDILKITKGEEKKFQDLVKKTNQDIERIEEVVAIRQQLNLSRPVFAMYLRTNTRTLENWEQGRAIPNAQATTLIRLVERFPQTIEQLAALT